MPKAHTKKLKSITEFMWLIYPKATFLTLRGSLRPLRRVAARALERFAFCATSLRFTSFIFGACVRRAPSEPALSAFSGKKVPRQILASKNLQSAALITIFCHLSPLNPTYRLWEQVPLNIPRKWFIDCSIQFHPLKYRQYRIRGTIP